MKKSHTFTERDQKVLCSNPDCARVRGAEGVARRPIKKSVIERAEEGRTKFLCYDCAMFEKTGKTRSQLKRAAQRRAVERREAYQRKLEKA